MNTFLVDSVAGPGVGGFAGIKKINLGNVFWGGGSWMAAIFLFASVVKGGF